PLAVKIMSGIRYLSSLRENDPDFHYAHALTEDFVPSSLDISLTNNPRQTLHIGYGLESPVCPLEPVTKMMDYLEQEHPDRVFSDPIPGEAHNIFGERSREGKSYYWPKYVAERIAA